MSSGFVHGEAELAEATGFAEKNLRRARAQHLRQGIHWSLAEQHVRYSAVGAQLVIEHLLGRELTPAELGQALKGSRATAPAEKEVPIVAKVTKTFPNPWLLQVELPSGQLDHIRVKSSKNFRRGMAVPLRMQPNGHYELARKLPRFPGRW